MNSQSKLWLLQNLKKTIMQKLIASRRIRTCDHLLTSQAHTPPDHTAALSKSVVQGFWHLMSSFRFYWSKLTNDHIFEYAFVHSIHICSCLPVLVSKIRLITSKTIKPNILVGYYTQCSDHVLQRLTLAKKYVTAKKYIILLARKAAEPPFSPQFIFQVANSAKFITQPQTQ